MTDDDKIQDKRLSKALSGIEPPVDEVAKQRAIKLAVAEFRAYQEERARQPKSFFQGLWQRLRPTTSTDTNRRRTTMTYYQRILVAGMSTACVGLIALGVFSQYMGSLDDPLPELPEIIVEPVPIRLERESNIAENRQLREDKDNALRIQPAPEPSSPAEAREEEVIVAGIRSSLEKSMDMKREAQGTVSAITAQDIGKSSGQGNAESLMRLRMAPDSDVDVPSQYYRDEGRDQFEDFEINPVKLVSEEPVSTFSVDVDTASYSFVRRQLNHGVLPQKDAVRIEELINYFDYDYPLPDSKKEPFKAFVAVHDSPWAEGKKLLHIGIKGYEIDAARKPRSNLVFLLDVSGSMNSPDKLPLVKQSMELLLTSLNPEDTVAIAVYAGAAGTVLEPTKVKDRQKIVDAMKRLEAGGSTAGAEGIRLAYQLAEAHFDKQAINRVILATDGDFNVGITNREELQDFVERQRDKGIFLSVLGFGQGNYHDHMMQTLAQNGNGVAAYIDTLSEAQKVLVDEATSTLFPIAKDVKIQVEFNPNTVAEYRLIGYETRHLNREDFNNDAVDAGDIGAGHSVTALYEITPAGSKARLIDESRYAGKGETPATEKLSGEYAFLKLRYKLPDESTSKLITQPIGKQHDLSVAGGKQAGWIKRETGFAAAVAGFAQLLKGGQYTGEFDYDDVIALAQQTKGDDAFGYRTEFIQLARKAKTASAME
ncbi:MAG TPA: VWA domain-containing protein [Gammaproteobacteria bacterium]